MSHKTATTGSRKMCNLFMTSSAKKTPICSPSSSSSYSVTPAKNQVVEYDVNRSKKEHRINSPDILERTLDDDFVDFDVDSAIEVVPEQSANVDDDINSKKRKLPVSTTSPQDKSTSKKPRTDTSPNFKKSHMATLKLDPQYRSLFQACNSIADVATTLREKVESGDISTSTLLGLKNKRKVEPSFTFKEGDLFDQFLSPRYTGSILQARSSEPAIITTEVVKKEQDSNFNTALLSEE
eukprot:TRINITY_DN7910_c0_g1_i1.p1 TRINITY_DN7910_c0_g1~~TRINITY_DN7910_c0_g1_i1.p1  ORF type:complete len:238 (+),score=47.62 TRINITY_DN7910_c0_g1_i1:134-847(+)